MYNDNITKNRSIKKDYKEIAITGYVKHNYKNLSTSQFFLKEGPLAIFHFHQKIIFLLFTMDSPEKYFFENNSKKITTLVKNKFVELLKNKQDITISNIQSFTNISLRLRKQYHQKNMLILR